jgi:MocE subfamily Rieske [2Fe-2S] domain protein
LTNGCGVVPTIEGVPVDDGGWERVAALDDIDEGDLDQFEVGGQLVAIHRTADGVYATAAICTHEFAELRDGLLQGHVIECPKHNGRFDVRTGAVLNPPASVPLATYPCQVRGDEVWVCLRQP